MTLGEKIQRLRTQRRLTQTELAQRADVDQAIISRLERNLSYNVRSDLLKALATVLGCTTDYLVGMHEGEKDSELSPTVAA
jgi:XRE family transcriptional regulator, master regulator for biofilm formation